MFKNLELVIFDMDGLMFDTERVYLQAVIDALNARAIAFDLDILHQSLGTTQFDLNRILKGELPKDFDFPKLLIDVHEEAVDFLCANGVPKKPGLDELLDFLEEKQIRKAIASSTHQERCFRYLDSLELTDRFEVILTGNDVERVKPHPDLFVKACQLCDCSPAKALVLEDSYNGAIAAKAATIKCILIPDIVPPNQELKEIVYCILDSLHDVVKLLD